MKIKFISLNLFEGGLFFDNILKFLDEEKPDIIALQEVFNSQDLSLPPNFNSIETLTKKLPNYFYNFAPELKLWKLEGHIDAGNAIFSRFPILKVHPVQFFDEKFCEVDERTDRGDFSHDPKTIHGVEIQVEGKSMNIFNLHGLWGLDGGDNERRLKMSEIIVNEIKDKENVILSGDFNIKPNTKTILNIEKYLKNVFKDELTSTFNMKHKTNPGYATAVVDMIFTSPQLKIVDHYCPQVDISDHLPLVTVLEI